MFILGLIVLFLVLGAWDVGMLPGAVILALLVGVGVGLARMTSKMAPKPVK
jgi:hypothetical protein